MFTPHINSDFSPVLEPLGAGAGDFFLAAGLYHAHKISFSAAAALAGLGFGEFHHWLNEHYSAEFTVDDESVLEDLHFVKNQMGQRRMPISQPVSQPESLPWAG